jgi:hypothetical protein
LNEDAAWAKLKPISKSALDISADPVAVMGIEFKIGRDENNDMRLPLASVSGFHASISRRYCSDEENFIY